MSKSMTKAEALLYHTHLCQKGKDTIVHEKLYKGTSKSAEGYAACATLKTDKQEGMKMHIQCCNRTVTKSMTP